MNRDSDGLSFPWESAPAEGEATEVAEGLMWMRLPLLMALDHVNVYALDDGDGWTLVDTGLSSRRGIALWERLLAGPLSGRPVRRVIVTHHHPDHVGLAGWFAARGAEILTSRTSYLMARMLTLDVQETWPAETLAFYRAAGMDPQVLEARRAERPFNFADSVSPLPLGYHRLTEGVRLEAGGRSWTVAMGAGHAPEHVTLWSEDGALVLGGDQLLPGISPNLGVYPTEPEADPVADWLSACRKLSRLATDAQLVLPGHKLPFRGLPLRLTQLIDNHVSALDRLAAHLATPHSAGQCFLPLFRREVRGAEYGLALVEAYAHCLHLWHHGRARRWREDGVDLFQAI